MILATHQSKRIGVLKLQLQAADGMSRRRMYESLATAKGAANRAKNAAALNWYLWRTQNPRWQPAQRTDKDGLPKFNQRGEPMLENAALSQAAERAMYTAARAAVPELYSLITSRCVNDVIDMLKADTPDNHPGKAKKVHEAILLHEFQLGNYNRPQSRSFPVPGKAVYLFYCGLCNRKSDGITRRIEAFAGSSAAVRFPVWSRDAGQHRVDVLARIAVSKMRKAYRHTLRRIAAGDIKALDSDIVEDGGKWFLHLFYERPAKISNLDESREAVLTIGGDNSFTLMLPDATPRKLGSDEYLYAQLLRMIGRRKAIEFSTRFGQGRGHGRGHIHAIQSRSNRQQRHQIQAFTNNLRADVMKACVRANCGKLVYREPTLPLRKLSWFAQQGIEFAWHEFGPELSRVAVREGLKFRIDRMGVPEWKTIHSSP